ncbi:hypothetical protein [Glutamicibacter arilaitensis]|uniref:hypothetical protein n=1 Tax=Glutamicibacter arilaitensis TaxID=256701 RepID=UPI003FD13782
MSFKLGGVDTSTLAGVTAILSERPSLGGLSLETVDNEGRDGRAYASPSRTHAQFVFDVIIEGATPTEVIERADNFVGLLDPSLGPRPLQVEPYDSWQWESAMIADEINWGQVTWERGTGFILRGEATIETSGDPSATEIAPQVETFSGSMTFARTLGNTVSYPKLVFSGYSVAGGEPWLVQIGSFSVTIEAGIASGLRCSLDWQTFEFYLLNSSGAPVGSLVPKMSNFNRPALRPGQSVSVSVTRGAVTPSVTFYPNNRKA